MPKVLIEFVKRHIVDDVPEDLAVCEFDCPYSECNQAIWSACERRIGSGAGALFPR